VVPPPVDVTGILVVGIVTVGVVVVTGACVASVIGGYVTLGLKLGTVTGGSDIRVNVLVAPGVTITGGSVIGLPLL
jgi:hypothetical protein